MLNGSQVYQRPSLTSQLSQRFFTPLITLPKSVTYLYIMLPHSPYSITSSNQDLTVQIQWFLDLRKCRGNKAHRPLSEFILKQSSYQIIKISQLPRGKLQQGARRPSTFHPKFFDPSRSHMQFMVPQSRSEI